MWRHQTYLKISLELVAQVRLASGRQADLQRERRERDDMDDGRTACTMATTILASE